MKKKVLTMEPAADPAQAPAAKAAKNGHLPQLKADQQLVLSKIRSRAFQHRAQAGAFLEEARKAVDAANGADLEFSQVLQGFVKGLNVDANKVDFDTEKLQFKKKTAQPAAPAAEQVN